jgi:hypothetical protein
MITKTTTHKNTMQRQEVVLLESAPRAAKRPAKAVNAFDQAIPFFATLAMSVVVAA